jgi:hypothetical protein
MGLVIAMINFSLSQRFERWSLFFLAYLFSLFYQVNMINIFSIIFCISCSRLYSKNSGIIEEDSFGYYP